MPLIQGEVSVAAGATNDNVIAGSQYEYLPYNAFLQFGVNGSATGLLADIYSGQDVIAENIALNALNRTPIYPDDFPLDDVAGGGERIKIRVRNPTGGALTAFFAVKIMPAG